MKYRDSVVKLADYRRQIGAIRADMRKVQAEIEPEAVEDYVLQGRDGPVRLSELFGGHEDLILVLNMGAGCRYCTLWADGFNGVYPHLASRAAFVVASPDPPDAQARFAASRGWRFPMVSHRGTSFAADMGYTSQTGAPQPGICAFQRKDGRLVRVSDLGAGPYDDLCAVWHLFDLFPEGAKGWQPQYKYPD
ncbi:MAG: DUF899 family protein [Alphaproteobacteria bacterium]|nr:DUF899 family protein [Alphaproteobacteria bacterium]